MENDHEMSLGEFIAKRRKYLRMTQDDLAERLYVSKSAVAKWETDGGLPDRENLRKLAEVLNVTTDDLYHITCHQERQENTPPVNVTKDLIALLESYGYRVIGPFSPRNDADSDHIVNRH